MHLIQDLFYLIQVEYSSIRSTSIQTSKQLILQMFEDGSPRSIPTESLYISEHFTGSPIMVTVHPCSYLCSSVSSQTLSTGTVSTAGINVVLTLEARDSFGNPLSVESISSHNVVAYLGGWHTEHPEFMYSSYTGNISASFALFRKGFYYIQWFVRGVALYDEFSITVVADFPDFSSLSSIGEFHRIATAGLYFQHAMSIFDNFGNMRSFWEKEQDFSQNIQLAVNISTDAIHYNSTICRSDTEYAPLKYFSPSI